MSGVRRRRVHHQKREDRNNNNTTNARAACERGQQQRQDLAVVVDSTRSRQMPPGKKARRLCDCGRPIQRRSLSWPFFGAWRLRVGRSLAVPLFATMCLMFPLCYAFDRTRRYALSFVNDLWAICSTTPFVNITVEGREHLPRQRRSGRVYAANHQSLHGHFQFVPLETTV